MSERTVSRAVAHQVLLEGSPSAGGLDDRPDRVVAHGQHAGADAEAARLQRGDLRQRRPGAQTFGAEQMRREVAVAELEPRVALVAAQRLEGVERVARDAPAAHRIRKTREGVEHGVDVGRDVEAVEHVVVGRVHDDRQLAARDQRRQSAQSRAARHRPASAVTFPGRRELTRRRRRRAPRGSLRSRRSAPR